MVWKEPIRSKETSAKPIGRWAMKTKLPGSSPPAPLLSTVCKREATLPRKFTYTTAKKLLEPPKEEKRLV
ncbi:hypothetical protein PFLUV_G00179520 [Perca fluviatilis]|uniref:Uncharacterized protein n=1 Tax=Perca fluviatilis TaxID=8168 RepID=A0A6A5EVQ7_PERFL|nr:hypothetical protein PFLUV_G00179520 [Perca fluviatilis]